MGRIYASRHTLISLLLKLQKQQRCCKPAEGELLSHEKLNKRRGSSSAWGRVTPKGNLLMISGVVFSLPTWFILSDSVCLVSLTYTSQYCLTLKPVVQNRCRHRRLCVCMCVTCMCGVYGSSAVCCLCVLQAGFCVPVAAPLIN